MEILTNVNQKELYTFLDSQEFLINEFYENLADREYYIRNEINNIQSQNSIGKFFVNKKKLCGFYCLIPLDWDSKTFKKKMYKMKLVVNSEILPEVDQIKPFLLKDINDNSINHINCQVNCRDSTSVKILESLEFKLMDTIIRYSKKLTKNEECFETKNGIYDDVGEYKAADYQGVLKLAEKVFENYPNRFYNDESFDNETCKNFYVEWAKNSIQGFADIIITSKKENKINGFSTVKFKQSLYSENLLIAEGQLAGVESLERGQGINSKMLVKRLEIASEKADYYEVGTQVYNFASQRTFYKNGLKPIETYYSFHL